LVVRAGYRVLGVLGRARAGDIGVGAAERACLADPDDDATSLKVYTGDLGSSISLRDHYPYLPIPQGMVTSPNGSSLYLATADGQIIKIDTHTWEPVAVYPAGAQAAEGYDLYTRATVGYGDILQISPDGTHLSVISTNGVQLIDLTKAVPIADAGLTDTNTRSPSGSPQPVSLDKRPLSRASVRRSAFSAETARWKRMSKTAERNIPTAAAPTTVAAMTINWSPTTCRRRFATARRRDATPTAAMGSRRRFASRDANRSVSIPRSCAKRRTCATESDS
jgi:hypothetical protein